MPHMRSPPLRLLATATGAILACARTPIGNHTLFRGLMWLPDKSLPHAVMSRELPGQAGRDERLPSAPSSSPSCAASSFAAQPGLLTCRAAADRQRVVGHVLVMTLPDADIGAVADRHRRDQRGVRADEGALADLGAVLAEAVVVAGDRAGADVGPGADMGVADIGQVVDLGAGAEAGVLDLDEVADLRPLADRAPGRSRAKGPTIAPAAIVAPSIWQKAWIVTPSAIVTPGPKTTFGSTVTSRPILVS